MTSVVLRLPMPPSVNALWRSGKGRVYASPKYRAWKEEAGWALKQQRPGKIKGPYDIGFLFGKRRGDLDNYMKPVSDLLQQHGIIENDRLAQYIVAEWDAENTDCTVRIEEATNVS